MAASFDHDAFKQKNIHFLTIFREVIQQAHTPVTVGADRKQRTQIDEAGHESIKMLKELKSRIRQQDSSLTVYDAEKIGNMLYTHLHDELGIPPTRKGVELL